MFMWLLLSYITCISFATCVFDEADGNVTLAGGNFEIMWKIDHSTEEILLYLSSSDPEIIAAGSGYLGFGLSEVSQMIT